MYLLFEFPHIDIKYSAIDTKLILIIRAKLTHDPYDRMYDCVNNFIIIYNICQQDSQVKFVSLCLTYNVEDLALPLALKWNNIEQELHDCF